MIGPTPTPANPQKPGISAAPVTFSDLLVAVGKTGNRDAFIRLFEYFAPRVKSFLMKSGIAPDQADELAQETMLTVWHRAGSFNPALASASTWIFTIARNKRIDWLRKMNRPEPEITDPMLADPDAVMPDDALGRAEDADRIALALKTLPAEQADLIHKSFYEDKSHAEIAAETDLPLGTVKSRLRLAMDRLRRTLGEDRP